MSSSLIRRSSASRSGLRVSSCPTQAGATQDGARLLSEALRLSLRRGAGPFRSAARVAFEPRAYQLVPLLMALRLPVVRLLIADDVGIGKTIEAGLILRELIDRGEADRFAVLCPPHLVEQWTGELESKVRSRCGGGHGRLGISARTRIAAIADVVRCASLHRRQPRLHQGRPAARHVCAGLPEARRGRRGTCLRRDAPKSAAALRTAEAARRRRGASSAPVNGDAAQRRRGRVRPAAEPARSSFAEGALESEQIAYGLPATSCSVGASTSPDAIGARIASFRVTKVLNALTI